MGPLEHVTRADYEEAMAVHFWGPLHTIEAAVPHMRKQGGGRIANISSFGGKIGVPHMVPYCASKFALAGLSSALTPELARDNIAVTTVCPGLMRTGSPFNASFKGQHREEFAWFAVADSLPLLSTSGRRAAAQIVEAIRHGDAELVITWAAKLAVDGRGAHAEHHGARSAGRQRARVARPVAGGRQRAMERLAEHVRLGAVGADAASPSGPRSRTTRPAATPRSRAARRRPDARQAVGRCGSSSTCARTELRLRAGQPAFDRLVEEDGPWLVDLEEHGGVHVHPDEHHARVVRRTVARVALVRKP